MATEWMMRGSEYVNCNCAWGCPCQFNSPTTYGNCEAVTAGHIQEGNWGETSLDGLDWVLLLYWPGEIAQGNGREQAIIDERATDAQRQALSRILYGEDTTPGATHFFVFNTTMSEVLEPLYAPVELDIDVDSRTARLNVPGLVESAGSPLVDPFSGGEHRASIHLPNGFEYTTAEVGTASSTSRAGIELVLSDSHSQFSVLHMNQDGVIR
ncbi:MAG: DUF1326 domain-containing protein [Acidobacteriota bacterium]